VKRAVDHARVATLARDLLEHHAAAAARPGLLEAGSIALELRFPPDPRVHDGRFAHLAWLQELPDPVTSLTWGNAAHVSPATAARLGVATEGVVAITHAGRTVSAPVLVVPGHADGSISLALGAHEDTGGVDAYRLRTSHAPNAGPATVRRAPGHVTLARGQTEFDLHGRDEDILPHRTLAAFHADPTFTVAKNQRPRALYLLAPDAPRQWGMTVDLGACVGCNACVVACQAENNVPIVGKTGVAKGRRMHWLRVDRYEVAGALAPQPMLCQHCEKAPCEYVCPVNATTHSADGLNQMVYNRCVGTRFCSNNCPYKVRRFNYFDYHDGQTPLEELVFNPDVTVRERGVMEKCTFCVQRIREREIHTKVAGEPLADGAIVTACEAACPTRAFVFGDLADPRSRVSRNAKDPRAYAVLNDLGTLPRVRYLARVSNPNPELA
jgi:molybdopterin-containing oxidoreductase family iron-sulfur binding subunit